MSDALDDLLNDLPADGSGQSAGSKLRKQLEAVLEQNKALQERIAQAETAERDRSLSSAFAKHQIPELARDFFPKDTAVTDEAITEFAGKYGQLWGATSAAAVTPPAQQQATQAMQQFASQASPTPVGQKSEAEYAAMFAETKSRDEFLQLLTQLGDAGVGAQ